MNPDPMNPDPMNPDRTIPTDPHEWARSWLPVNDDPIRPLITLATVGLDGVPNARTVLLSSISPTGFRMHTDVRSAKAVELAADPRVCLVLAFPERAQQVVVQGTAVVESQAESLAAWGRRSVYLRQLAWLNDADHAQLPVEERRGQWAAAVAAQPEGPVDPPVTWVGYEVVPHRYVFWEGGTDLASRRTEFRRNEDGWAVDYLPG